jgi:hypothetical protein
MDTRHNMLFQMPVLSDVCALFIPYITERATSALMHMSKNILQDPCLTTWLRDAR